MGRVGRIKSRVQTKVTGETNFCPDCGHHILDHELDGEYLVCMSCYPDCKIKIPKIGGDAS